MSQTDRTSWTSVTERTYNPVCLQSYPISLDGFSFLDLGYVSNSIPAAKDVEEDIESARILHSSPSASSDIKSPSGVFSQLRVHSKRLAEPGTALQPEFVMVQHRCQLTQHTLPTDLSPGLSLPPQRRVLISLLRQPRSGALFSQDNSDSVVNHRARPRIPFEVRRVSQAPEMTARPGVFVEKYMETTTRKE